MLTEARLQFEVVQWAQKEGYYCFHCPNGEKRDKIKFVIYTVPYSKYYLEHISKDDKQRFIDILQTISKKQDISVYFIQDKYIELQIWNDPSHVAFGGKNIPHNDDIAEIIRRNLNVIQHN